MTTHTIEIISKCLAFAGIGGIVCFLIYAWLIRHNLEKEWKQKKLQKRHSFN